MKLKIFISFLLIIILFFTIAFLNYFQNKNNIAAIVVPHHDAVAEKRSELFRIIASQRNNIQQVILISPDHFSGNYQSEISCSNRDWDLSNGRLESHKEFVDKICENNEFRNELVKNDHGIFNVLPDIKRVWPEAKVVPILVGQKVKMVDLDQLVKQINENCSKNCLLIASVDFSHYLPVAISEIHDIKSNAVLNDMVFEEIHNIEVDSKQSLYILMNFAGFLKANKWELFSQTNSSEILKNYVNESTSHLMGYYRKLSVFEKLKSYFMSNKLKSKPVQNENITFLISRKISYLKVNDFLNERFFWGQDYLDTEFEGRIRIGDLVILESEKTELKEEDGILKLYLGKDMMVGGGLIGDSINLAFLPLGEKDGKIYIKKDDERDIVLDEIFQIWKNKEEVIFFDRKGLICFEDCLFR